MGKYEWRKIEWWNKEQIGVEFVLLVEEGGAWHPAASLDCTVGPDGEVYWDTCRLFVVSERIGFRGVGLAALRAQGLGEDDARHILEVMCGLRRVHESFGEYDPDCPPAGIWLEYYDYFDCDDEAFQARLRHIDTEDAALTLDAKRLEYWVMGFNQYEPGEYAIRGYRARVSCSA